MALNMAFGSNLTGAEVLGVSAEEAVGFLNAGRLAQQWLETILLNQ